MAAIDSITLGNLNIYEVDADPSITGVVANIGDVAVKFGAPTGVWQKFDSADTDWVLTATSVEISNLQQLIDKLEAVNTDMKEPTGFVNTTDSEFSFNETTRTFTIQPIVTSFDIYIKGIKQTISSPLTKVIPDTTGTYYLYIGPNGVLDYFTTFNPALLDEDAYVSYVYWNSDNGFALIGEERHGITMDSATHGYLHTTRGTQLLSGGNISFDDTGDGTANADAQVAIGDLDLADEDLRISIRNNASPSEHFQQVLSPIAELPIYCRTGATGAWTKETATQYPMVFGTNRTQFNKNTGGVWSKEDASADGKFLISFVIGTTLIDEPVGVILGQQEYDTLALAQEVSYNDLDLGDIPIAEIKILYYVIYETDSTFTNAVKSRVAAVTDVRFILDRSVAAISELTAHGSLSGLGADDHTQYLLEDGSRPLSGNLSLGSNNITNVGTLNGVTVETHASRHLSNGADPIPSATTTVGGLLSAADKTKLNGTEITSQLDDRDTANRARANHTGTQLSSTISNFAATVRSTILTGITFVTGTAVLASDSILIAIGKLQRQITNIQDGTTNLLNVNTGHLSYSNASTQNITTGAFTDVVLGTDRESFANGKFTKLNSTTFRADFTGQVEISYNVSFNTNNNDRSGEFAIQRNTTDLTWTRTRATSRDEFAEATCASGTFILNCTNGDLFTLRGRESNGSTVTIPADYTYMSVKVYRITQ
jgi:hypothetical protein